MKKIILAVAIAMFSLAANAVELIQEDQMPKILENKEPAVIEIYADWCPACQHLLPMMEKAEQKYKGKIRFYKINIDNSPKLQQMVTSIPVVLMVKDHNGTAFKGAPNDQKDLEDLLTGELLKTGK